MPTYQKRAVLFSRMPAPVIARIITCLNGRGYEVPLLVCSPGANHFLLLDAYPNLGALVGSVFDNIDDPPAVLCVTRSRSLARIYASFDPDLALVYAFSYAIPEMILRHKAPVVNFHPAPLPQMRGPVPWPHMVLDQSIDLIVTWLYMTTEVDRGPIIHTCEIRLPEGKDRSSATGGDIANAAIESFFRSIDRCLDLVEAGHPGVPQSSSPSPGPGASFLSDEERIIRDDMTVEEILCLNRALDGTAFRPLFRFDNRLYYVTQVSRVSDEDHGPVGFEKRVGTLVSQVFQGGKLRMDIRKI